MITEFCCGAEAPKEVEEEKPHDFEEHTYKKITKCDFCRKVLKGMRKQGFRCKKCGLDVHKECMDKVPQNCSG